MLVIGYPRSPGTQIVGPWAIDSINSHRDLRTGTQYVDNWASRDRETEREREREIYIYMYIYIY